MSFECNMALFDISECLKFGFCLIFFYCCSSHIIIVYFLFHNMPFTFIKLSKVPK